MFKAKSTASGTPAKRTDISYYDRSHKAKFGSQLHLEYLISGSSNIEVAAVLFTKSVRVKILADDFKTGIETHGTHTDNTDVHVFYFNELEVESGVTATGILRGAAPAKTHLASTRFKEWQRTRILTNPGGVLK